MSDESGDEKQIPEKVLADLKDKHGDVWTVVLGDDVFGITMPKTAEYDRFMSVAASDRARTPAALRTLASSVVVYPAKAEYDAIAKKRPGIPARIGNEALKLAGAEETELAKKS